MARKALLLLWISFGLAAVPLHAQLAGPLLMDTPRKPVPALDFEASTPDGKRVRLKDYRGKVVFLNFWATWCVPCLREMPAMERLSKKMAGRAFTILAVNLMETPAQVRKFLEEIPVTFTIVMDTTGEISENYGATSLPLTYIIDKKGRVIHRALGPREWDGKESLALFKKLAADGASETARRVPTAPGLRGNSAAGLRGIPAAAGSRR